MFHVIILFIPSSEHRKRPVPIGAQRDRSSRQEVPEGSFQFCKYRRRKFLIVKSKSENFHFHLNWIYFIFLIIGVSSTEIAVIQGISHLPSWGAAVTHDQPHSTKMCHCRIFFTRNSLRCGLFIFYSHTMIFILYAQQIQICTQLKGSDK